VNFFRFSPDFARYFDILSRSSMIKKCNLGGGGGGPAMEELIELQLLLHQSLAVIRSTNRNCLQLVRALNHTCKFASVVELYFLKTYIIFH